MANQPVATRRRRGLLLAALGLLVAVLVGAIDRAAGRTPREPAAPRPAPAAAAKAQEAARADRSPATARHDALVGLAVVTRGHGEERIAAAHRIRNLGDEGLQAIRDVLDARVKGPQRDAALFVLAVAGTPTDREVVGQAFLDHAGPPSGLLAQAAARIKDPAVCEALLGHAGSSSPQVRAAEALSLRHMSFPAVRDVLRFAADAAPEVRAAADKTMLAVLQRIPSSEVADAAEESLASPDPMLRVAGLRLCERVDASWGHRLAARAASDSNWLVRAAAMHALAALGVSEANPQLERLLAQGPSRQERMRAADTLSAVPVSTSTVTKLVAAARGGDPMVALASARALLAHGDERALPILLALRHTKESVERNIDDEDADLLADFPQRLLRAASRDMPRRSGENWNRWWRRVRKDYRCPGGIVYPSLPKNH